MVKDVFELVDKNTSASEKFLKCGACEKCYDRNFSFNVTNVDYKKIPGCKQPKWFGNMKKDILKHLKRERHMKAAENYSAEQRLVIDKKKDIMKVMEYLSYFDIKTNMSF